MGRMKYKVVVDKDLRYPINTADIIKKFIASLFDCPVPLDHSARLRWEDDGGRA